MRGLLPRGRYPGRRGPAPCVATGGTARLQPILVTDSDRKAVAAPGQAVGRKRDDSVAKPCVSERSLITGRRARARGGRGYGKPVTAGSFTFLHRANPPILGEPDAVCPIAVKGSMYDESHNKPMFAGEA
ncbi:hypothetical protein GCM10009605_41090 [Nocardiopsis composta]